MTYKKYDREEIERVKEFLKNYLVEKGVQFNGNYFKCFCHDDDHPSAMILNNGKRYKCFKCQAFGDIFDAYVFFEGKTRFEIILEKLINKYLGNDCLAKDKKVKQVEQQNYKRGKFEAEYIYKDEMGREIFKIQRYNYVDENGKAIINKKGKKDKYFIAYKKQGDKWIKGIDNTPRYIYNFDKVKKAIKEGKTVLFVEGEKSCDILEKWGFYATTTPFGANGVDDKLLKVYKKQIEGANIVLIPDNDQKGYEFMFMLEREFKDVVKSIKIIKLADYITNFPVSGDIEEWINLGGTKDRLLELINSSDIEKDLQ